MVSSRLVDLPDSPEENQMRPIPEMMFAPGEEPVGVRVLTYQSSNSLKRIFNALEEDEIEVIRQSSFGKLIEIAEKPAFSGRIARYLLSRQLKTKKKHELWFRFSGQPVRFSLREFAIVTGLACGKFPRRSKMKLKRTVSEKSYWPALFGKAEVVTVAAVIKMLYRKTVKDKEIRVKYACLALLESVLLPTSLNMKIAREHAEAIADIGEFFSFPWGRLAFDLLMGSIKERDELALSQNTIAVKGFVLALQLVLVAAVPALTEVVDDTCSSSESDDEEDEGCGRDIFSKKHTLNPAHARNVDKGNDAVVDSLLDEEPLEGLDVENVIYSDEERDPRVDNLVDGIRRKTPYTYDSFQGGLKHIDVVCMRQSSKRSGKTKKSYVPLSNGEFSDPSYIAAIVIDKIQPKFDYLDKTVNGACSTMAEMEGSIFTKVESVLTKFREDLSNSVKEMVYALCKENMTTEEVPKNVPPEGGNAASRQANEALPVGDVNASTIRNVLTHLSEYSTPPRSIPVNQGENLTPTNRVDGGSGYDCGNTAPEYCAQSATSETRARQRSLGHSLEKHNTHALHLGEEPSFSLGLTQEEHSAAVGKCVAADAALPDSLGSNIEATNIDAQQFSRKSKRRKTVPLRLVETYECGPHFLTLCRKAQKFIFLLDDMSDMERKFEKLSAIQNKNSVVDVAGIGASVKEILFIVERKRNYSAKIVDILVRVMCAGILSQIPCNGPRSSVLLETKFVSSVIRTYPRFLKSTCKEVYNFPAVLREVFPQKDDPKPRTTRYYFPFNVGNKHWVGICFDAECGHITILDALLSLHKDAAIEKYITPLVQMLPYLARYAWQDIGENPVLQCFDVFRPKSVAQVTKSYDSGLMSLILMATHALYGLDACKTIKPELLSDEAKRAAILAYEFKETL